MTDSSTGGYLKPNPSPGFPNPLGGPELLEFFQELFSGITGVPGPMIRPRWQQEPAPMPPNGTDWLAIGIQNRNPDAYANDYHVTQNFDANNSDQFDGTTQQLDQGGHMDTNPPDVFDDPAKFDQPDYNVITRHETFEVLCSIYGPNADDISSLIREGLSVPQNRENLALGGMGLVSCGQVTPAPTLTNTQWQYKLDMVITFKRSITRTYPIRDILSATGELVTDISPLTRPIIVNPPPGE